MEPQQVWLDTDPGSDIDDAIAIGYLLSHPECRLIGISTVTGQPIERAKLASVVCRHFGREEVTIASGAARPFLVDVIQGEAPHARVLPNWPHRTDFEPNQAVTAMREAIRARPGEVELMAIGPLTNVGLLFLLDPEIPSLLKGLTIMGGRFTLGTPVIWPTEHNINCDPHAAAVVFAARGIPKVRVVGLDVTLQVTQTRDEIHRAFTAPTFAPILEMAEEWFRWGTRLCYHDIVAAATLFRPDLFRLERGTVTVRPEGQLPSYTHFHPDEEGPHEVAAAVDRGGFLDHFCQVTGCTRV